LDLVTRGDEDRKKVPAMNNVRQEVAKLDPQQLSNLIS
jgi:hypothetical protein